jgi:hypothetical protein
MPKPLSPETIAIIKSTAPALRQHGLAITIRMYERLFVDPDIKVMFDEAAQKSGEQPKRLAGAILAFAENVDRLEVLTPGTLSCGRQRPAAGDQGRARRCRGRDGAERLGRSLLVPRRRPNRARSHIVHAGSVKRARLETEMLVNRAWARSRPRP